MSMPSTFQSAARGDFDGSSFTEPFRNTLPSLSASHLPSAVMTTVEPLISSAPLFLASAVFEVSSHVPTSFIRSFSASSAARVPAVANTNVIASKVLVMYFLHWSGRVAPSRVLRRERACRRGGPETRGKWAQLTAGGKLRIGGACSAGSDV